jgi:hypothetical protein
VDGAGSPLPLSQPLQPAPAAKPSGKMLVRAAVVRAGMSPILVSGLKVTVDMAASLTE